MQVRGVHFQGLRGLAHLSPLPLSALLCPVGPSEQRVESQAHKALCLPNRRWLGSVVAVVPQGHCPILGAQEFGRAD